MSAHRRTRPDIQAAPPARERTHGVISARACRRPRRRSCARAGEIRRAARRIMRAPRLGALASVFSTFFSSSWVSPCRGISRDSRPSRSARRDKLRVEFAELFGRIAPLAIGLGQRALHALKAVGGLLEQGLHVCRHARLAVGCAARRTTAWSCPTAIPRVRCRSGSARGRPAGRENRAPANWPGRTARWKSSSTCPTAAASDCSLSWLNVATGSLPTPSEPMMSATERIVTSRPQNVPSRPRKIARPTR